jgi:sulfite reductase (NADPH) flavoprotein alpha-component
MTMMMTPTLPASRRAIPLAIPVIPETAPFSAAQRAWLNGFLAGVLNQQPAPAQPMSESITPPPARVVEQEEERPWHDPALSLEERLKLAEAAPKEHVLMAAMAQLDCGACGYVCKTYAEAIARGEEADLTKCAPGGTETAKKLKQLLPAGAAPSTGVVPVSEVRIKARSTADARQGHDRGCSPVPRSIRAARTRIRGWWRWT